MKHRRVFAVELKRQIVEELLSGMSTPAQLTRRYEISRPLKKQNILLVIKFGGIFQKNTDHEDRNFR